VADVVTLMQAMFAAAAEERALELVMDMEPALPQIDVDPRRVEQVLANLLRNAVKFAPGGARVVLSARLATGQLTGAHPGRVPEDAVQFAVSDTGPGIPPENLTHIFDWFWQSPQGGQSGTGLGLAIAKGLIEAHGEHLLVESIPGQGTTFSFTVPTVTSGGAPRHWPTPALGEGRSLGRATR
jgi:signal transduction histidine kinase